MNSLVRALFALTLVLAACAPTNSGRDGGGGDDDDDGDGGSNPFIDGSMSVFGTVSGTVWAPGNNPDQVTGGQEIPIAGAVIYLLADGQEPTPIPDQVYCQSCQENPSGAVVSDNKGRFTLTGVSDGHHRLVIEKAQFRLVEDIDVAAEFGLQLTAAQTTLPSEHDPANGKWLPRVAIVGGDSDHVEDIFGKMKILKVDSSGTTIESSLDDTDRVDMWGAPDDPFLPDDPGNSPFPSHHKGTVNELFGSMANLSKYHIIFVPCNYQSDTSALASPAVRKNIRDYVAAGGHLYVTDWSAEWEDAAFPDFIQFDQGGNIEVFDSHDTTKAQADANLINAGDGDFGHFAVHGKAEDPGLAEWLDGQKGPVITPLGGEPEGFPSSYADGTFDANDFVIEGAWNMIRGTPKVNIGNDADGNPVITQAKVWITGEFTEKDIPITTGRWPHTVTFEPTSCGRVLYSTYHTAEKPHPGLMAQERVLLYLILELGVCSEVPPIP